MNTHSNSERGFILLVVVALMLLLAVIALAMNRDAALNLNIAANRTASDQNYLGEVSCIDSFHG